MNAKPFVPQRSNEEGIRMSNDDVDPEDFDYFIQELQELIKDSPSTMQARFAKVIVSLRQRKSEIKEVLNSYFKDKRKKKRSTIIFQALRIKSYVTKKKLILWL